MHEREHDRTGARSGRRERRRGRVPPPLCEGSLERAAVSHLERYSSSAENLRQVLRRRAQRSCAHHGGDLRSAEPMIEAVIQHLSGLGLLDDRAYGVGLVRRLRARGCSTRHITARLLAKGIAPELVDALLSQPEEGEDDPDLAAADTYARRRRLGPYRDGPRERARYHERDLATLSRAGYSSEIARRIIGDPP